MIDQTWFILQDPATPGEHIVLESVGVKLTPLWLSSDEAEQFANENPAAKGMQVQRLETPVFKEAFIQAVAMLGVKRLLVGYRIGRPSGQAVELEVALLSLQRNTGSSAKN